jgi:polysaccharide biosynthesis/export protein
MSRFYSLCGITCCTLFLNACSLLPGMTFTNPGTIDQSQINTHANINPTLVPITPELIAKMQKDSPPYEYHVGPGDHVAIVIWSQPAWSAPAGAANIQTGSSPSVGNNLLQGSGTGSSGYSAAGIFGSTQGSIAINSVSNNQVNDYLINSKGYVFLPYLGNVYVAGKTKDQLQTEFTQLYKKYIRDPQITIRVTTFASQQIYVLGEANQQALLALIDTPMSLAVAIADAGGINPNTANPSQIFVIRGDMQHPTVYWLDSESPVGMLLAQNFTMENHDVIFISPAAAVSWNRVVNQVLPSIQAVWYTKALINNN